MTVPSTLSIREINMVDKDFSVAELFRGLDTAGVSDALDKLGLPGQCYDVMPLDNYKTTTVGLAYTVRYEPSGHPPERWATLLMMFLRAISSLSITMAALTARSGRHHDPGCRDERDCGHGY